MPRVESEPTTPVLERAKAVHAFDRVQNNRYETQCGLVSAAFIALWHSVKLIGRV
jgi:hypothetical protein